jgi:hypothetical protein
LRRIGIGRVHLARRNRCRGTKGHTMERIIAGRFDTKGEADLAAAGIAEFIDKIDISVFDNKPAVQNEAVNTGGVPERRPAGVMLSVRIGSPKSERVVIAALRKARAADIEQAEGDWSEGAWTDFNPVTAPQLIKGAAN